MASRIIDFILRNECRQAQERLEKLIQMNAPRVMIQGQQRLVEELSAGKIKVSGDQDLLQSTFETFEIKKEMVANCIFNLTMVLSISQTQNTEDLLRAKKKSDIR